jgi:hypothetical protein
MIYCFYVGIIDWIFFLVTDRLSLLFLFLACLAYRVGTYRTGTYWLCSSRERE